LTYIFFFIIEDITKNVSEQPDGRDMHMGRICEQGVCHPASTSLMFADMEVLQT
jgi:hypothetical protein